MPASYPPDCEGVTGGGNDPFDGLIGASAPMREVRAVLGRAAATAATILLEGASGTGKEVAARAVHLCSSRRERPLVVFDCAAVPKGLIESELFGHARGAFTGAVDARRGVFAAAADSTLFLDEISELPLELQPRLLRMLERGEVKPVGANSYHSVDVRVIAATNRDLAAEVEAGRFRQDLYYRLSVIHVHLPSLAERLDDILPLAHHLASSHDPNSSAIVTPEVEPLLVAHDWPGNVRELRNLVEQLAVVPEVALQTLRGEGRPSPPPAIGSLVELEFHEGRRRWQEIFDRQYLASRVQREGFNISRAAEATGLARQTLHRLLRRYKIDTAGR